MPALDTRAVFMSSLGLLEASGRPELVPRCPDRVMLPGLEIGAARGPKPGYPWNFEDGLYRAGERDCVTQEAAG